MWPQRFLPQLPEIVPVFEGEKKGIIKKADIEKIGKLTQTFPDDFVFTGSATDQAKQIGNAVPVQLGEVLINQIINVIYR